MESANQMIMGGLNTTGGIDSSATAKLGTVLGDRQTSNVVYTQPHVEQYVRQYPKVGRNDPCPCGSGKKYKKCCLNKGTYEE